MTEPLEPEAPAEKPAVNPHAYDDLESADRRHEAAKAAAAKAKESEPAKQEDDGA